MNRLAPRRASRCLGACLVLAAAALLGSSCARRPPSDGVAAEASSTEPGAPVDPVLLAFLSRARAAHHRADLFEAQADPEAATRELERLLAGPLPSGAPPYPETLEVRADTHARLADLRSRLDRFDDALRDVRLGLELATERTYFRGHLFEVQGLVEERRAERLARDGDAAGADAARQRALVAFEQAMAIQGEVIQRALGTEQPP